jgi:ribosome-binding factor A
VSFRKERIADLVLSCLGVQLRQMLDERLSKITFTEVKMTPDLKIAKVYFSTLGGSAKEAEEALKGARGIFRKKVGEDLQLRYTPNIQFYFDESVEEGNKIETLLNSIKRQPNDDA